MITDPQTIAYLTGLVVSICGVLKDFLKEGPKQNSQVRLMSALAGAAVFVLAAASDPAIRLTLDLARTVLLPAAAQGFTAGAAAALLVKSYHLAQDGAKAPNTVSELAAVASALLPVPAPAPTAPPAPTAAAVPATPPAAVDPSAVAT